MQGVLVASLAVFLNFHSAGIVAAILLGGVVSLLAVIARKSDYRANIFLFRGHANSIQSFEPTDASLLMQ
jgi:hypothetical protein